MVIIRSKTGQAKDALASYIGERGINQFYRISAAQRTLKNSDIMNSDVFECREEWKPCEKCKNVICKNSSYNNPTEG